jgi:outer membrane protein assembly factor BamE (lipoprotein component of BamABCDE complex)
VLALLLTIAGCSANGSVTTSAKVMTVETGMNQNEVLAIMGRP